MKGFVVSTRDVFSHGYIALTQQLGINHVPITTSHHLAYTTHLFAILACPVTAAHVTDASSGNG
jgi:hypothetical protein